jgi:hypothetical protein
MELNNTTQNSVHKLNVTFVYRRWFPYHRIPNAIEYPEVWESTSPSVSDPFSSTTIESGSAEERRMLSSIETFRSITRDPAVDNTNDRKRMRSSLDTFNSLFQK